MPPCEWCGRAWIDCITYSCAQRKARIMAHSDGFSWTPRIRVDKFDADQVQDAIRFLDGNGLRSDLRRGMEPSYDELQLLQQDHGLVPSGVAYDKGNQLTDLGRDRIANLIIGSGAAAFNSAQSIVGVGDSSTAFAGSQTALQAATNRYYKGTSSAPAQSATGKITCAALFGSTEANFAWNEWCWAIGTGTITPGATLTAVATGTVMLNRRVPASSLGTKGPGASWTLTTEVTINAS